MKDIRIGNDIQVSWTLYNEDVEFPLDGLNLHVYLKDKFGSKEIDGFLVSGNEISWTFSGKDQRRVGVYSLELVINENEDGMITTDACQFVNLVPCSCKVSGSDDNGVHTETIELQSSLSLGSNIGYIELQEAIEDLNNRLSAHSEDIVNLQENKADKSELTDFLPREEFNERIEGYATHDSVQELSENVTELSAEVGKKQDTITDLADIRSGAEKGATALQEVPETYATKTDVSNAIQTAITNELNADF